MLMARATLPCSYLAALALCGCNESLAPPLPDLTGGTTGDDGGTVMGDAGCGLAPAAMPGLVMTDRGAVRGAMAGSSWSYKGIPYAAPPTGNLRFRPPVEHACFGETLDASKFGNSCLQLDANGNVVGDEDCLTLNIWSPASAPLVPMPVMVFIHGGGNTQGSSSALANGTYLYDAQPIAEAAPVVVVTINYRLGVMGFFALPALDAESEHHASGNYGLLDQVAALQWVKAQHPGLRRRPEQRDDLRRVGGRGERVHADGVAALDGAVHARADAVGRVPCADAGGDRDAGRGAAADGGLRRRARRGGLHARAPGRHAHEAAARRGERERPRSGGARSMGPTSTGGCCRRRRWRCCAPACTTTCPSRSAATPNETSQSVPGTITTEMIYAGAIHMVFGQVLGDQVLALYPASDFRSPRAAMVAVTTDARFVCPSRQIARAVAANQTERVYRYFFTHALDNSPMLRPLGAWHGLELLFVFNHLNVAGYVPSPGEVALSESMIRYWTRFALTGDPNGVASPWPAYDVATDPYLALDNTIAAGAGVRTTRCDFWDKLSP